MKDPKKLRRPKKGRVLAGVCAAFANYFGIDVVFIRLVAVLLLLPGGFPGLVPYVLCWLVIPSEE
jgi:phage shock protein PspC (stress-responsive transcriptional regulator)